MITHVIVELKYPVEDEYFHMDTVFPSEYYGYGTPLIRCKDCKYWQLEHYVGGQGMSCQMMISDDVCLTEPTHFCGWAERKEE